MILRKIAVYILITLFSNLTISQVDLTTLDNWKILSTSEHDLFISKEGASNSNNFIGFQMHRPFCVCKNPIINLVTDEEFTQGSTLPGSISVDLKKKTKISLKVLFFEAGRVLLAPLGFPSLRESKLVEIESSFASEKFLTEGIDHAMDSSSNMCNSNYYYHLVEPEEIVY